MRTRLVRVKRKHARSMRLAMLFFVLSLAIYLLTLALRPAPPAAGPVLAPQATSLPLERMREDIRFEPLSCYWVELGQFDSADLARIEAARYVRRGAAGYVYQEDESYLVIGACYDGEQQAQTVAQRLIESEQLPCRVRAMDSPGVGLRITATRAQIDALVLGERCLRESASRMGEISLMLDGGTLGMDAAVQQLSDLRATGTLRQQSLERALGDDQNQAARDMLSQLTTLQQLLSDRIAGSDQTALSFSAKIKYNTITVRMRHIQYLNSLAA